MAPPFYRLTLEEFAAVLDRAPFTRRVNGVHLHHTWRPNQGEYRGQDTLASIWRQHTEMNGWSTIGQHATVAPDGAIWSGRGWNCPPVSASGNNGNRAYGPFSLALIGDFGHGRDRLEGKQRSVAVQVIALLQRKFGLDAGSLRLHSQLSRTSCPGTSIDYELLLEEVRAAHAAHAANAALGEQPAGAAPERDTASAPFGDDALELSAVIEAVGAAPPARDDPPDAEPHEDAMSDAELRALFRGGAAPAGDDAGAGAGGGQGGRTIGIATPPPIPAEILNSLRPHVVNLNSGQFSGDGQLSTTPGDVDAIFDEYLVRALEGAQARKEPLRVLFYAHGGLTSESEGLRVAEKHVGWWRRNNVYPIYFVWETGLFETLGQMLQRAHAMLRGATRDIFDFTSDPLIEALVRALYAPQIWSGMKRSAELAAARDGGAQYVAQKLKAFCDRHKDAQVELHAAGHSAGAIFQAHFLSAAHALKTPSFRSLHLLAPAINAETFRERLADRLGQGKGVDHLTVFTMNDAAERDDDCNGIYRKSLLYLIYYALERSPKTPILGLETCLRNDRAIRDLLGLGGVRSDKGEVILSPTISTTGRSASQAVRHGAFDDDASTLNSMARRVLGADDNDPIAEYTSGSGAQRGAGSWSGHVDWPPELAFLLSSQSLGTASGAASAPPKAPPAGTLSSGAAQPGGLAAPHRPGGAANNGRRRALCVGINEYPTAPLYGCVADAQEWRSALGGEGFDDVTVLTNRDATRQAILESLRSLVTSSAAGDVVVFQFAGHGTQLPDTGTDEAGSDTPEQDEAICAYDFADGAFVVDDDIGEIFERIPRGVNVTCFIDCCHSGTISRFGVGTPPAPASGSGRGAHDGPRPRFVVATPELIEAHRRFRDRHGVRRSISPRGLTLMKEVLFSACLSSEVAYESAGHGDFTTRATRLLRGPVTLTNEQFEEGVISEFGAGARQHPRLYCRPEARALGLLQPLTRL